MSKLSLGHCCVLLLFCGTVVAQPPPGRRPPPPFGRGGGPGQGSPLERAVNDLNLPEVKRESLIAAVRDHQDDVRRINDLATADLILKMKGILSPDDFKKFKQSADELRAVPGPNGRVLTTDSMAERVMSFDKTQSGKVRAEDLPERMQYLVAKGDANHDGMLDREEVKKLSADAPKEIEPPIPPRGRGRGGAGGPNPQRGGRGGAGPLVPFGALERLMNDLNLSGAPREAAAAALKAHQENLRNLTTMARADLMLKAGDVLTDGEFQQFTVAVNRAPEPGDRRGGPGGRGPGRPPGRGGPGFN